MYDAMRSRERAILTAPLACTRRTIRVLHHQTVDGSGSYGRVTAKDFLLLIATDRPSRHPGAPFGHGNAPARRQRSGHSRLAPPRPRMPWCTKAYSMMAPQGGLAPGAAGGCRGWAETQLLLLLRCGRCVAGTNPPQPKGPKREPTQQTHGGRTGHPPRRPPREGYCLRWSS